MDFKKYKEIAMSTNGCGKNIFYLITSLAGETGELLDALKKGIFHGHKLDKDNCIKEVGDILWSLAYGVELIATNDKTTKVSDEKSICDNFTKIITDEFLKTHFPTQNAIGHAILPNHVPFKQEQTQKTTEEIKNTNLMKFIISLTKTVGEIADSINSTCEIATTQTTSYIIDKFSDGNIKGNKIMIICKMQNILALLNWLSKNILDSSIEEAMEINIAKLSKRYNGSFSAKKSIERVDTKC